MASLLRQGREPTVAQDHVVENGNAECSPRLRDLAGDCPVVRRWGGISGWMIVNQDHRGSAFDHSQPEYLAGGDQRSVQGSPGHQSLADHAVTRVEKEGVELLLGQVSEPGPEQDVDVPRTLYSFAFSGPLCRGAPPEFEGSQHAGSGGRPHSRHTLQCCDIESSQAPE